MSKEIKWLTKMHVIALSTNNIQIIKYFSPTLNYPKDLLQSLREVRNDIKVKTLDQQHRLKVPSQTL